MPAAFFTPETLKFLRGLARHNDREWFEARREVYERAVRTPLLALIEAVNAGMAGFAPDHVRPPAKAAMRIYRDTRFSPDKRPYKRHLAAWWAQRGLVRTTGAGFYFHLSAVEVTVAAGVFVPSSEQVLSIRRWLQDDADLYRRALKKVLSPRAQPPFEASDPQALRRVPRGFPADHPAADLLRATRWGVGLTLPAEAALDSAFAELLLSRFRAASPLVLALTGALSSALTGTLPQKAPVGNSAR